MNPLLSVVVVVFNMQREARRTLHSLSTSYQRDIGAEQYDVIVVDNGSKPPFPPECVRTQPGQFETVYVQDAPPSSARPAARARGSWRP